jgi:3-oxoacyl-[acyl-carrier-protein] synthase-3
MVSGNFPTGMGGNFHRNKHTTDEWIRTRTGIRERRFAEPYETMFQYAAHAAERALTSAGLRAQDIDLIILSTTTPDKRFPSTANKVQQAIGASNAYAYDISVACSGFIFALASAPA